MQTEPGAPNRGAPATLVDLTAGGHRYPAQQAARLGADIAAAVAERHARGLVHGAITPAAVVVVPGDGLALRDPVDPALATADRALWTAYAAPEQLLDGQVSPASDVYALGGLLQLMVTGAPPFPEFDADLLRERKLQEAPPAPSTLEPMLPAAFDELIRRALQRDPGSRPTAQEVAARLQDLARGPSTPRAPVHTERLVVEDTVTGRGRPDPWVYVLAGVIALAVLALILALVLRDDSPTRTTVPAVTGLRVSEATGVLQADHLRIDTVTAPDGTVAAGIVAAQNPAAGARVDRGRTVVLTVSSGVPATTTPVPIPIPVPVPQNSGTEPTTTTTTSTTTTTTTTTAPAAP